MPVIVDSPMAAQATQVYNRWREEHDEEYASILARQKHPLRTGSMMTTSTREESKALNNEKGTRIIISASGMMTGGRVMHSRNLDQRSGHRAIAHAVLAFVGVDVPLPVPAERHERLVSPAVAALDGNVANVDHSPSPARSGPCFCSLPPTMMRCALRMTKKTCVAAVLCAALALTAPMALMALATQPVPGADPQAATEPGDPAARFTEDVGVGWVMVPVVVRQSGGYVRDLDREDFELLVDGKRVPIESFESGASAPVHLVILQDTSGSMETAGKLTASREIALHILGNARPVDQFSIATFSAGKLQIEVPFTSDREALDESVRTWEAWGTTALHDAVAWLPTITADRNGVKRAAVLVTDGLDNASNLDATQARELVRQAQLPVYVFGFETGDVYTLDAAGKKVYRYSDMLNLLASLSGGQYYPIQDPDDLKEAMVGLIEDLRHQYVLGFSVADDGSGGSHRIQVRVSRGSRRTVSARAAYRGGDPLAPGRPSGHAGKP